MCKIPAVLLTLLLACVSFGARAQMADRLSEHPAISKPAAAQAVALTRDMSTRLHLNEGQFLRLLPLNRTKLTSMSLIDREYRDDPATRAAKAAELEAQYEQECGRILTPTQLSQLQHENGAPAVAPASTGNGMG
jgi:hypothetical protein